MYKGLLKITVWEAHVMRTEIVRLKLKTPEWFGRLSDEELAACYNGAGSDDTPAPLRKVLTRLLGFAEEAVLIHDAEYQYAKRFYPTDYMEQKKFHAANRRLGENAKLLAIERTPWYSLLRYWRLLVARDAQIITDQFGYNSWVK